MGYLSFDFIICQDQDEGQPIRSIPLFLHSVPRCEWNDGLIYQLWIKFFPPCVRNRFILVCTCGRVRWTRKKSLLMTFSLHPNNKDRFPFDREGKWHKPHTYDVLFKGGQTDEVLVTSIRSSKPWSIIIIIATAINSALVSQKKPTLLWW